MALSKSIATPYGIAATYHHICAIAWDKTSPVVKVQLASFVNEDARRMKDGLPLGRFNVDITVPGIPTLEATYAAVKELPDWSDAQDVLP